MNPSNLLAALTLVVLALLTWQLRWVLLVIKIEENNEKINKK